jgi:iron complex outermembrane receptor protein
MNIFVRGFDRWQVPLTVDGVRIYLPADNRLDFARFLTADIAAVQIQKGYASVLDGPGAMGGAINLVTTRPTKPFQIEGGLSGGGRSSFEGSNGYMILGTPQPKFYAQGTAARTGRAARRPDQRSSTWRPASPARGAYRASASPERGDNSADGRSSAHNSHTPSQSTPTDS